MNWLLNSNHEVDLRLPRTRKAMSLKKTTLLHKQYLRHTKETDAKPNSQESVGWLGVWLESVLRCD